MKKRRHGKNDLAFNNETIQAVMEQISQVNDTHVVFDEKIGAKKFWLYSYSFKDITEVIAALELTRSTRFKVEGRSIMVMK